MKTWYVSGPMSGYENHNFEAFDFACQVLRMKGLTVLSPHEIPHAEPDGPGSLPWDVYLRNDLIGLLRCTGIVLLQGWPQSRGARLELDMALGLGLEIAYLDGQDLIAMGR